MIVKVDLSKMKSRSLQISLLLILLAGLITAGCKKDEQRFSGTDTIDNTLVPSGQTFAIFGFSFELGKVISNLEPPGPDITVHLETDINGIIGKYLGTVNLVESFALAGEYPDASEASAAFDNLLEVGTRTWQLAAWGLEENQVWLFKSSEGSYVKFRIIEIQVDEQQNPPYIEVTFKWRIQPDGSEIFSK